VALVIGDHTCVSDLQNSLIFSPEISSLVEKAGTDEVLLLNTRYRGVLGFIFRVGDYELRIPVGLKLDKKVAHPTAAPLKNASAISHQSLGRGTP